MAEPWDDDDDPRPYEEVLLDAKSRGEFGPDLYCLDGLFKWERRRIHETEALERIWEATA